MNDILVSLAIYGAIVAGLLVLRWIVFKAFGCDPWEF